MAETKQPANSQNQGETLLSPIEAAAKKTHLYLHGTEQWTPAAQKVAQVAIVAFLRITMADEELCMRVGEKIQTESKDDADSLAYTAIQALIDSVEEK